MALDLAREGHFSQAQQALLAAARLIGRHTDLAWYLVRSQLPQAGTSGEAAAQHHRLGLEHAAAGDFPSAIRDL
jgi:hypothetical protein